VVSEESGTISLVTGGRIRRGLDARSLREALLEAPEAREGAKGGKGAAADAVAAPER